MEDNQNEEKYTEQVATRMTKSAKQLFEDSCTRIGKKMSDVMREMIDSFMADCKKEWEETDGNKTE